MIPKYGMDSCIQPGTCGRDMDLHIKSEASDAIQHDMLRILRYLDSRYHRPKCGTIVTQLPNGKCSLLQPWGCRVQVMFLIWKKRTPNVVLRNWKILHLPIGMQLHMFYFLDRNAAAYVSWSEPFYLNQYSEYCRSCSTFYVQLSCKVIVSLVVSSVDIPTNQCSSVSLTTDEGNCLVLYSCLKCYKLLFNHLRCM